MDGSSSKGGIGIGIALIAVGAIVAWIWLGDTDMGESPVDEAAGAGELGDQQEGGVSD